MSTQLAITTREVKLQTVTRNETKTFTGKDTKENRPKQNHAMLKKKKVD